MSAVESKKAGKSKGSKKKEVLGALQTPVQLQPEKKKSNKASKNREEKKEALDDEEGWIDVKNMKRLKADLRKAKKVILAESKARELKSDVIPEIFKQFGEEAPASPVLKSKKGEIQPKKEKT
jgi:hypothetical protein